MGAGEKKRREWHLNVLTPTYLYPYYMCLDEIYTNEHLKNEWKLPMLPLRLFASCAGNIGIGARACVSFVFCLYVVSYRSFVCSSVRSFFFFFFVVVDNQK